VAADFSIRPRSNQFITHGRSLLAGYSACHGTLNAQYSWIRVITAAVHRQSGIDCHSGDGRRAETGRSAATADRDDHGW
jgi:hypothetical protein